LTGSTTLIPVVGTYNFRDVGGYRAEGGVTRRGKLFRSDALHALGDDGRGQLRELGVKYIVDLRDDAEVEALPDDIEGLDVEILRLPVFEGSATSQTTIGGTLVDLYAKIVLQHTSVVAQALKEVADTGEAGVIVHCTAGKDRTGIVVALALLAVGVDRDIVVADYAATQVNLQGPWLEKMLALVESHGVEVTPELRIIMGGSPPEALEAVLDLIDRERGGVRQYLLEAGVDEIEQAKLRSVLVEPL